ncbi:MAG: type II secretion system secretin GspD, partial [Planctomycetota bacterium]|nr:type II secretion system secretin GspD [Planctomycetota bacterium]
IDQRRHPLHVAIENFGNDANIGAVVRTANAFAVHTVHIVGRRRWNRRGAMVTDRYQRLEHHDTTAALLDFAAAAGLTVINDIKLDGRINVLNRRPLTIEEALSALNSVLKDKGYVALRTGKTLKIVAIDAAKKATLAVHTGNNPEEIEATDEMITQVVPVRFADATQLKRDLAPLIPSYADLSSNTSTNTLILTDTSANVRRIVEIVRALDTSVSAVTQVKVFPLKYANATTAARLLNDVFKQDSSGGTQGNNRGGGFPGAGGFMARFLGGGGQGGGGFPGGGGAQGATNSADGARPQAKVTASADDRTNMLVVSAPNDVMVVIEQVLKDLDANPAQDQAVFVYRMRNAQAVNVQNVVNSIFNPSSSSGSTRTGTTNANTNTNRSSTSNGSFNSGTRGGTGGGGLGSTGGLGGTNAQNRGTTGTTATGANNTAAANTPRLSPGSAQSAADLAGQVFAVADPDSNSVLITTATGNFDRVKAILAELDRPVPQVLIKALLAEVSHDNNTDLGVEFSAVNLVTGGNAKTSTDFGVAGIGSPAGGLIFKLVQGDYNVALAALQQVGKIDVLSRPYILASDNQLSSIIVGQTVPYVTFSQLTDTGQTINSISYQDIGIILNVTPHINADGIVVMDVAPEISSIDQSTTVPISSNLNATVFNKRAASTRVAIKDGQTIVIGGLMQDQKNQTQRKVPFLGDLPLLGPLLQRNTTKTTKTELLIFLTPHVAREPERLQAMSDEERKGATITPKAVGPGVFDEHYKGLQRGADHSQDTDPTTRPSTQPTTKPAQDPATQPLWTPGKKKDE